MSSFPDGYVPLSRTLPPGKRALTDAEKQAAHWKEQNAKIAEGNVALGKEALEKSGPIPSLSDVYTQSTKEAQERTTKHMQEVDASPYAMKIPLSMLPPNDRLRQAQKLKDFPPEVK